MAQAQHQEDPRGNDTFRPVDYSHFIVACLTHDIESSVAFSKGMGTMATSSIGFLQIIRRRQQTQFALPPVILLHQHIDHFDSTSRPNSV
jgi:hypothetical protein